jgi:hypothetical protein
MSTWDLIDQFITALGSAVLITFIVCASILVLVLMLLLATVKDYPERLQRAIDAVKSLRYPKRRKRTPTKNTSEQPGGRVA